MLLWTHHLNGAVMEAVVHPTQMPSSGARHSFQLLPTGCSWVSPSPGMLLPLPNPTKELPYPGLQMLPGCSHCLLVAPSGLQGSMGVGQQISYRITLALSLTQCCFEVWFPSYSLKSSNTPTSDSMSGWDWQPNLRQGLPMVYFTES